MAESTNSFCLFSPTAFLLFPFILEVFGLVFYMLFVVCMSGLDSFDFLGLGYRVDWPVSIVVTPRALEIYAQIFSFLIRVKLAVFSLTDIWSSLKVWINTCIQCLCRYVSLLVSQLPLTLCSCPSFY